MAMDDIYGCELMWMDVAKYRVLFDVDLLACCVLAITLQYEIQKLNRLCHGVSTAARFMLRP